MHIAGISGLSQNTDFVVSLTGRVFRQFQQFSIELVNKKVAALKVAGLSATRNSCASNPVRNAPGGAPLHPNAPLKKRRV
jgi:hypothetical protein